MSTSRSYTPFLASALLMYLVVLIIYPHYQYYIDPDGTSYLTISQRYANGDIAKAINGYWSPWSCWLTAGLIKWCGMAAIPASWLVNTLGATGFLYISQSFFLKFNITRLLQWILCTTLAFFLCYAIFAQSFDDLWECFFLLSALRIMLAERFIRSPAMWGACGIIGALAYFAKAYAFPFFMLNTAVCSYLLTRGNTKKWLQLCSVAIVTMLICSLPWILALHNKYDIWTTSTAGVLNRSWYLVGHPYYKEGIGVLIPPTYPDSPSYWEDPWYANGPTPQFWSSWHLFGLQILRIGLNAYKFVTSGLQLSLFFPPIFVVALFSLFRRKLRNLFSGDARIMMISFLLFPLAYFLINFESRYIWYMLPPALVMGAIVVQNTGKNEGRILLTILFPITFLIYPAYGLYTIYDVGRLDKEVAEQCKELNIRGSFASLAGQGWERQRLQRIAYFSASQFYNLSQEFCTSEEMKKEVLKCNLDYYFHFNYEGRPYEGPFDKDWPNTGDKIPGFKVYYIHP